MRLLDDLTAAMPRKGRTSRVLHANNEAEDGGGERRPEAVEVEDTDMTEAAGEDKENREGRQAAGAKRLARGAEAEAVAEEGEEACPSRQEDYRGWLAAQKRRWKRARLERKKAEELVSTSPRHFPAREAVGTSYPFIPLPYAVLPRNLRGPAPVLGTPER